MSKQIAYIKLLGIQEGFNLYKYSDSSYTLEQIVEIYRGYKEGLDVSVYDDVKNDSERMYILRECLYSGVPTSLLKKEYSNDYLNELLCAHKSGLDVSYLIDLDSDIEVLRKRISKLREHISWAKLLVINEKDVDVLVNCFEKGFKLSQVKIIAKCVNLGVNYDPLLNIQYSEDQLNQLFLMLKEGIDVEPVATPEISWLDMALYRLKS